MTNEEYRAIMVKHKIEPVDAAKLFGIHRRTAERFHYAEISIGPILARLVRLLGDGLITPQDIARSGK